MATRRPSDRPRLSEAFIRSLGYRPKRMLGTGGFGEAWELTWGRVFKLTASRSEEFCVKTILHTLPAKRSRHLPHIERAGPIPDDVVPTSTVQAIQRLQARGKMRTIQRALADLRGVPTDEPVFWYVREELRNLPEKLHQWRYIAPALDDIWRKHGVVPIDTHFKNFGLRKDGTIVIRDVACMTDTVSFDPQEQLTPGPPPLLPVWIRWEGRLRRPPVVRAFTNHLGASRVFAVALHERTGWPIVRAVRPSGVEQWFVRAPGSPRTLVDPDGFQREAAWRAASPNWAWTEFAKAPALTGEERRLLPAANRLIDLFPDAYWPRSRPRPKRPSVSGRSFYAGALAAGIRGSHSLPSQVRINPEVVS